MKEPEFLKSADNVYRTRNYIVKQEIFVDRDKEGNGRIFSRDTYYLRNTKLNREYESVFRKRAYMEGRRLPSTSYTRKYIEEVRTKPDRYGPVFVYCKKKQEMDMHF